jgi:tripartite-type tricarboxylate transporter receptor subunit TctC
LLRIALWILISSIGNWAHGDCSNLPDTPIRWIVPNTTGSMYDFYARTMESALEGNVGVSVHIDNVSGGGGIAAAREIAAAPANGATIGIVNGAGLLVAGLTGREGVPQLADEFHILGRASPTQHVWVVAGNSPFQSLGDLRRAAPEDPIVFGVRNVASSSFASVAIGAHVLDFPHSIVAGYASNRDTRLAVLRGEVDVVSMDRWSGAQMLESGGLRAILQLSNVPFDGGPGLAGVPTLTGGKIGRPIVPERLAAARALVALLKTNRLFVAPRGLDSLASVCLEEAIAATLADEVVAGALESRASRVDFATGVAANADLQAMVEQLPQLATVVRAAADRLR